MRITLRKLVFVSFIGALGGAAGWLAGELVLAAFDRSSAAEANVMSPILAGAANTPAPDLTSLTNSLPAFEADVQSRLDRESAQSGDVQISLLWHGTNDLDLHCIDPTGDRIWHEERKSKSGGELDVDMNARFPVLRRIALILDTSGSMSGGRLAEARMAAIEFVRQVELRNTEVAVIGFNTDAQVAVPFTQNRRRLEYGIQLLASGGGTGMHTGIAVALEQMGFVVPYTWRLPRYNVSRRNGNSAGGETVPVKIVLVDAKSRSQVSGNTLLLFTDGQPNEGTDTIAVSLAAGARERGVDLIAIGAAEADVDYLRKLAVHERNVLYAKDGSLKIAFVQAATRFKSLRTPLDQQAFKPQKLTIGLAIIPKSTPAGHYGRLHFPDGVKRYCSNLIARGHSIVLSSTNSAGYFVTGVRTNMQLLNRELDSIPAQIPQASRSVMENIITRAGQGLAGITNRATGLVILDTGRSLGTHLSSSRNRVLARHVEKVIMKGGQLSMPMEMYMSYRPTRTNVTGTLYAPPGGLDDGGTGRRLSFSGYGEALEWLAGITELSLRDEAETRPSVARNERISGKPLENIYWPKGEGIDGTYRLEVVHFEKYGLEAKSNYEVHVRTSRKKLKFAGSIMPGETNEIFVGYLAPRAERLAMAREQEDSFRADRRAHLLGILARVRSWAGFERPRRIMQAWVMGLWGACVAALICASIHGAQQWIASRRIHRWRQIRMASLIVMLVGLAGGMMIHTGVSAVFGWWFAIPVSLPEIEGIAPLLGWPFLGVIIGIGVGAAIPNLNWWRTAAAGLAAGSLGGITFGSLATSAGFSRLVAVVLLGLSIGLVIKLWETLAREAALIVHWHENEQSSLNLGTDPIVIGSGPDVSLYVPRERGLPDVACLVSFVEGQIWLDDRTTGKQTRLQSGQCFGIGSLEFEIQTDLDDL
jgi:uncharacterized protein YegL